MREYLVETIGILEIFFLIPVYIVVLVVFLFNKFVLRKEVDNTDKEYKKVHYLFSLVVWLIVCGWIFYDNQFTKITYVYACNTNDASKCYKVKADYVPQDCEDTEWDNRGAHGGRCADPYFTKMYFDNGGYITFEYCDVESRDKWTCYEEGEGDGVWNLQISEIVKVKKQI